jgi:hypothetical protein
MLKKYIVLTTLLLLILLSSCSDGTNSSNDANIDDDTNIDDIISKDVFIESEVKFCDSVDPDCEALPSDVFLEQEDFYIHVDITFENIGTVDREIAMEVFVSNSSTQDLQLREINVKYYNEVDSMQISSNQSNPGFRLENVTFTAFANRKSTQHFIILANGDTPKESKFELTFDSPYIVDGDYKMKLFTILENTELFTLDSPVLQLDGSILFWEDIEFSNGYILGYGTQSITLNEPYYNLSELPVGSYQVTVKALADEVNPNYEDSPVAIYNLVLLERPSNLTYDSNNILSWDEVTNASGYEIQLGSETRSSLSTSIDLSTLQMASGEIVVVSVRAIGDNAIYADSGNSSTISIIKLETPVIEDIESTDSSVTWNAIDNADSYDVYVNGSFFNNYTTNSITKPYIVGVSNYTIYVVAISNENRVLNSEPSEPMTYIGG